MHILDVAENALAAGASRIAIQIVEETGADRLTLEIADNGRGMSPAEAARARDPFYTTRTTRRVGLGLPLLDAAAHAAGGTLELHSRPGEGTRVVATFRLSHIDRKPLGKMGDTIAALIAARPEVDLSYRHERDGQSIHFDTTDVRRRLGGEPLNATAILRFIREYVTQEEESITP